MEDATLNPYIIKKGLSEKQIGQLIKYAATDDGLKFTSDPKRFKDRQSFDEFSKEILAYYVLVDREDDLLGIIWFHDLPHTHVIARSETTKQSQSLDDVSLVDGKHDHTEIASSPVTTAPRNDEEIYGISFAIRLYGEARGKGLALPFTEEVMADFENSQEYKSHPHKKIWLSVSPENEPAVALYRKLGFKDLEINKEYNKLVMVL